MSEIKALRASIHLLLFISLFHIPKAASKPSGFSLKLISYESPMSPNRKNTTFLDRYKSYVLATKARASFEDTVNNTIQPDIIKPLLIREGKRVLVAISIGTPAQQVFLALDTGSRNSWTQCASCTRCFSQSVPKFDPRHSTSYRLMFADDPNCLPDIYRVEQRVCKYRVRYLNGQYSTGVGSYDTFGSMDNNPDQIAPSIRFGCSEEAVGFGFRPNTILSGILGMSRSVESLPHQLIQNGEKGRFSYCLDNSNTADFLVNRVTFGDDIPDISGPYVAKVPFIEHRLPHAWAIDLFDISVGDERLNLPPETFSPANPNGRGLAVDTGSILTSLTRDAYLAIKSKIQNHLSRRSGDFTEIQGGLDLCYRYNGPGAQLPTGYLQTITFHLEDEADLVVPVISVYIFDMPHNTFCLGMKEAQGNSPNLLGSLQQEDIRFIYDNIENTLSFIPELFALNQD